MKPIINPWLFYLVDVIGNFKSACFALLPSKKTCYQMMIASQITDDNIQKAEDTIKKSVDYIFEKINEGK